MIDAFLPPHLHSTQPLECALLGQICSSLSQSMPDQRLVALDRSRQVPDGEVLVVGVSDVYGAGTVEVAFVIACEVGYVRSVIYCHDFET